MAYGITDEQPNENQSSFGPSNQQSFQAGDTKSADSTTNWSGGSGWGNVSGSVSGGQVAPLPWQQNDMPPQQQSISQPTWQTQDVGHEGTTQGGMNRDQYRDAWMQSGISNNQGMEQWLAQHGGQRLNDAGVVRTPFGEILDMGIAYKTGQGKPGWTDIGMNQMPQGNFSPFGPSNQGPQGQPFQTGGMNPGGQQLPPMNPAMRWALQNNQFNSAMPGGGNQQMSVPQGQFANQPYNFNPSGNQQMDISQFLGGPSGAMTQGGGMNDPRWSNGTWGGQNSGMIPLSFNPGGNQGGIRGPQPDMQGQMNPNAQMSGMFGPQFQRMY